MPIFNQRLDDLEERVRAVEAQLVTIDQHRRVKDSEPIASSFEPSSETVIELKVAFSRPISMVDAVAEFEWLLFRRILEEESYNVSRASDKLNISRFTGYRLISRYRKRCKLKDLFDDMPALKKGWRRELS